MRRYAPCRSSKGVSEHRDKYAQKEHVAFNSLQRERLFQRRDVPPWLKQAWLCVLKRSCTMGPPPHLAVAPAWLTLRFSGMAAIQPLKHKDQATTHPKAILNGWERAVNVKVKAVRTDRGTEFNALEAWCAEQGLAAPQVCWRRNTWHMEMDSKTPCGFANGWKRFMEWLVWFRSIVTTLGRNGA
jgi:hypothetical protein